MSTATIKTDGTTTTVTPKVTRKTAPKAGPVTTTTTAAPKVTAAQGRAQRLSDALKVAKDQPLAEVGVALVTAQIAADAADQSLKTLTERLAEVGATRKATGDAFRKESGLMLRLAAELNPTCEPRKGGRNVKAEAVNAAIVTATGISPEAARKMVGRYVMAGCLHIAHGEVKVWDAYTLAGNTVAAEFWAIVAKPAVAADVVVTTPKSSRKPKTSTNVTRETKPAAPSVDVAREVVAAARVEAVTKMTPAQRTADTLRVIRDAYRELQDGIKAGTHAPLTKANGTFIETMVKALTA